MKKAADCPPSRKVELYLVTESKRLIQQNKDSIMKLSGAAAVKFAESVSAIEGKTVSQVTEIAQIYIPLGKLDGAEGDEAKKVRLAAEIERVSGEIERAKGKLANQNFVNRAPKKLVEDEQEKVKKYEAMKAKLEAQLAEL